VRPSQHRQRLNRIERDVARLEEQQAEAERKPFGGITLVQLHLHPKTITQPQWEAAMAWMLERGWRFGADGELEDDPDYRGS
jgi:hypothetical protein